MKLNIPVYCVNNSINPLLDWGIDAQTADVETVFKQPFKIAVVPVRCTQKNHFSFSKDVFHLRAFNLVIASDIECSTTDEVWQWAGDERISKLIAAMGSLTESQPHDSNMMCYRPWWMYNLLGMNQYQETGSLDKPFLFDALLGARKPHRDFVMLSMQKHELLKNRCLLSYRDIFYAGTVIDNLNNTVAEKFPNYQLEWPFVSPNIRDEWEVKSELHKSVSPYVPWDLFRNSWYSIVTETNSIGERFFLTEKTTKPLFAKRLFVMFSTMCFLHKMRELGFETFGSVIDESYDYEPIDPIRWQKAFDQVLSLSQQDPVKVYDKIKPVLDHNHDRLFRLQKETQTRMATMLSEAIPEQYIVKQ